MVIIVIVAMYVVSKFFVSRVGDHDGEFVGSFDGGTDGVIDGDIGGGCWNLFCLNGWKKKKVGSKKLMVGKLIIW